MEKPKDCHISSFREKSSKYSTVNLFLQHYFHQTLSKIWVLPWLHVSTWLILFSGLLSPFQFSLLGPQQSFHHSNANQVCLSVYTFTKYILESFFTQDFSLFYIGLNFRESLRVSVQGVKSFGGHFACLCRGFEFYEVKKKMLLFFKKKMEILLHF